MHARHMQLSMQSLIKQYDQRLSICCITVGSPKKTLELSRIVDPVSPNIQCINGAQLFSYDGLKRFVQTFFLQPVHDHDNDGIPDISDNCKNTPLHALVDSRGCPKDSDNDGVFDGLDRCQETFENVSVDMDGCWQLPVLFFKINQIYMTRTQETKLLPLVNILKKNTLCIEIQGHSDASGTKQKNIDISYKRAQGVMAFFLSMGLRHYQMKIKASGATIPLDHRYVSMQGATQRRVTFQLVACKN
ncbi:MAG: hypothetical protein OMM_00302 [Candidatus Magnetoglobus multicellularis str. Araruama]|uniref:OmpA-like domain-containing protein n=1 Tax=Candidatus Magnetoglobus multicellularis str. Araruama TaxID=890399 RepID=A0A1V1PHC4_9BACT|nr:MAG: hypothetical protein OMM_00302 [Candidatus Magnetoglobus multicellularis str. Araruama]